VAILYVAMSVVLALLGYQVRGQLRIRRRRKLVANARSAGAVVDDSGVVNARASYATMLAMQEISGETLTGKPADFMELTRLISAGPDSPDEIRFLLHKGFEPVVRPDGLVYVPCVENEHLFMDGEIPLTEGDLAILEE